MDSSAGGQDAIPGAVPLDAEPGEPFPDHWEADVVLRDGSACHLRPITPADGELLREFHSRLSPQTIYYRFFSPHPELTDRDIKRFTEIDHDRRVALVAVVGGRIVGIGSYDRTTSTDAEIAFTVRDDYQGRGLGSVLLEHIAAAARERGVKRFVAEVLPGNRRMLGTFAAAGYKVAQEFGDGVVRLAFDLEPTDTQRAVARAREQRAEAKSVERLFRPRSVAVIGASRRRSSLGNLFLESVRRGGFTGRLFAIHPAADEVAGVPTYPTLREAPGPIDLAVIAVPADAVDRVLDDAAQAGVHGLLVVSSGFAEAGEAGVARQRQLVKKVRGAGMRLVGPNALGIINTDSRVRLHAALAKEPALRGRVAVFCQSAAIGRVLLERFRQRGIGLSSFLSVGNRGDIASSDALHYWSNDSATSVICLYLDGIANPSKTIRIARDVARRIPIVSLRTGRESQSFPVGNTPRRTTLPPSGVQQLFEQAGFIDVDSTDRLLDVSSLLACQPLPSGRRVAIISDSAELAVVAGDSCSGFGLRPAGSPAVLTDPLSQLPEALDTVLRGDEADAVLVINSPPGVVEPPDLSECLLAASSRASVPVLAVLSFAEGRHMIISPDADGSAARGSVPVFGTVEDALHTLGLVAKHAESLRLPAGRVPEYPEIDTESARGTLEHALQRQRGKDRDLRHTVRLSASAAAEVLADYGINVWPALPVASEDEAVANADRVGWPVVLKTIDSRLSRRLEMGGVRLNIESEASLRAAYLSMAAQFDEITMAQLVVQRMAPAGVACTLSSAEDPLFGPVISFGIGGVVADLMADRTYRIPPITDADAAEMVRGPRGARLLFGYGGNPPVDVALLEDLLMRLGRMAEEQPSLMRVNLDPVVVAPRSVSVLGASIWIRPPDLRPDTDARRLSYA